MRGLKISNSSGSSIKIGIDVDVQATALVEQHLPDGTKIKGSSRQGFFKIEKGRLQAGDWLINPMTNEIHKVIDVSNQKVVIEISGSSAFECNWDLVVENLLLVIDL